MDVKNYPLPVGRALKQLGRSLRTARRKRRIPTKLAAQRAGISRSTLSKIEKGDGGVSLGAYAKVLFILGLIHELTQLASVQKDELGLEIETENLPKRIRIPDKEKN